MSHPIAKPPRATGLSSLSRLIGDWTLARRIVHVDGREDRFEGRCAFKRSGPRVIQTEVGVLETDAGRFEASRRYVWTENDGRAEVYFDDMRPFHAIPLGVQRPDTIHLCPPDRYAVAYDFSAWPEWQSTWTVEGPRKSYVMTNRFAPAAS